MHRRHVHKASVCPRGIKAHTFGYSLKSHEGSSQTGKEPEKTRNMDNIKQDDNIDRIYS